MIYPKRKSLLIVSESYWPTVDGGAIFEHHLAHALRSEGWRVYVWAPSPTGMPYVEDDHGVITIREGSRTLRSNPRYKVSQFRVSNVGHPFRIAEPSLVHIHNFALLGVRALKYARKRHLPVVATNHNVPQNWTSNLLRRRIAAAEMIVQAYLTHMLNQAHVVVSPTITADRMLAASGVISPRVVISNGVDTKFFRPSPGSTYRDGRLHLVHIGRLDREKTCELLIRAAARASRHRALILTVAGDGVEGPRLQRLAQDLQRTGQGTAGFAQFLGRISEEEKQKILQNSDLFVTASEVELQGISVLESMASGVPALAPAAGALPELCRPGHTGILFDPGNVQDCSAKLVSVQRSLLSRLGNSACSFVRDQHDMLQTHEAYTRLFDAVLRGRLNQ